MPLDTDPGLWKQLSGWLWAVLTVPLAMLWKKADNAASKDDLKDHLAMDAVMHREVKDTAAKLFENAEQDRRRYDERFARMQESIHRIHTEVMDKISAAAVAAASAAAAAAAAAAATRDK